MAILSVPSITAADNQPVTFFSLPIEIRNRVYIILLQPPPDSFSHKDATYITSLLSTMSQVSACLPSEIIWAAKRLPSIPQVLSITTKFYARNNRNNGGYIFHGYPQRLFDTTTDLWRLQYLVLRFRYANTSTRDCWGNPTKMTTALLTSQGEVLGKLICMSEQAPATIKKVRFDMLYDASVAERKEVCVAEMVNLWTRLFPGSKNVWAEAVGSFEDPEAREFIRSFNLTRRYIRHAHDPSLLDVFACLAARQVYGRREYEEVFGSEQVGRADWFIKHTMRPRPQYPSCGRYDMEQQRQGSGCIGITCPGCQAQFRSECGAGSGDEQHFLTRQDWMDHRTRMSTVKGSKCPGPPSDQGGGGQSDKEDPKVETKMDHFGGFVAWVEGKS